MIKLRPAAVRKRLRCTAKVGKNNLATSRIFWLRKNKASSPLKVLPANIFAALGEPNRLALVAKLLDRQAHSISSLSAGNKITRQAITKHLRVLEEVGLVERSRNGRESLYELTPRPLQEIQQYLKLIDEEWGSALIRLKNLVER